MANDPIYPALVTDALATVRYPGTGRSIIEQEMLADDIRIAGNTVSFSLVFDKATDPFKASLLKAAKAAVERAAPGADVTVNAIVRQGVPAPEKAPVLPGVKNIIAVSSGKDVRA